MNTTQQAAPKLTIWTCPNCKRQFRKVKPIHSCTYYPIERHMENKSEAALELYGLFIERLHQLVGDFTVESLPCCIHLVHDAYTFAGIYILHDKIRLHTMIRSLEDNPRLNQIYKSTHGRFPCSIDINDKKELDDQLFEWMRQAYSFSLR